MMMQKALQSGERRFGIVLDQDIVPGAEGRVMRILDERERPDGAFDVVVQAGAPFTVSANLWALPSPTLPEATPLMCTRARLADVEHAPDTARARPASRAVRALAALPARLLQLGPKRRLSHSPERA